MQTTIRFPWPFVAGSRPARLLRLAMAISFGLYFQMPSATATEPPQLRNPRVSILQGPERDRFVAAHNAVRKSLALDPLIWSDDLAAHALQSLQQQRETLIRAAQDGWATGHIPLPTHGTEHKYGENIAAWAGTSSLSAEHAVALWLREKPVFNLLNALGSYRVGDELPPIATPAAEKAHTDKTHTEKSHNEQLQPLIVGHYTQIIWRSTRRLGAAQLTFDLADDQATRHYVAIICNYDPPGNRLGEMPY